MKPIKLFSFVIMLLQIQLIYANEYSEIGLPVSRIFTMQEHGGSDQNWCVIQAKNGLMYVGTGTGITEWDGEQWQKYLTPNSTRVRALLQWQDGGLYVGTIDDLGVYRPDEHGHLTYTSLISDWTPEQRQFGEIWSIAANKHGVAFISNQNVYFWDGNRVHIINELSGGKHRIFALDDGFRFKTANQPFISQLSIDDSSVSLTFNQHITEYRIAPEAYVRQIFYNKAGKLVVVTASHGIYQQRAEQLTKILNAEQLGKDVHLYHAIQASDGYYYLVSLRSGIFILNEQLELLRHYHEGDNLGTDSWYSVIEDDYHDIWLAGTPNIVKFVPPHKYSIYRVGNSATIIDRLSSVNGKVVAAGDGLFQLEQQSQSLAPARFEALIASKSINFDVLEYHGYLLYSGQGGVFARPLNSTEVQFANILPISLAYALAVDPVSDTIFVTSYQGLFHLELREGQWRSKQIEQTQDSLEFIEIEESGVVWAGTPNQKLYRIENAQFTDKPLTIRQFTAENGLAAGNVMPFKLGSKLVIGTGDGAMVYQQNSPASLQFMSTLPSIFTTKGQDIFRLYQDEKQRLWYRIAQATGYITQNDQGKWHRHDSLFKPFAANGFKDFLSRGDNTVWFAQGAGEVYRANIELTEREAPSAQLHIRKVLYLDNKIELYGGLLEQASLARISQKNNSIRIYFALSNANILKATAYRHRLLGSGQDRWSDWSDEHNKDFTLLAGGDYDFQLEARDPWGKIYASSLPFSVAYPWYFSPLAWFVYGVLLLMLLTLSGWLTQRWRTASLRQRNLLLENTVAQRTQEIKQKVDELEQQQVLKERFFNNVSHEFRTPLTLTIAPLQSVLHENPLLDIALASPINTALRNAKKMLDLVGHILDINRLNIGQFPLRIGQYDVAELINQIVMRFENWAAEQGQTLLVENCENPVMVFFDRDQLDKCIANLLSNAIKYSGANSHITVSLKEQAHQVGIAVSDNGTGIDLEQQTRIFERYFQGQKSEHVSQPGTGLGLALVKELIELHHGQVTLDSQVDNGCCFTLWLKRGAEHFKPTQLIEHIAILPSVAAFGDSSEIQTQSSSPNEQDDTDITTVLVVDDNIELRQFIALKLSGYYRIIQACNGEEGLAKARALLPDLIISDVMMPKMDGITMLSELRKNKFTNTIPLILLSAKASKRDAVEGLQSGADDYLTKPFDTSELIARVDGLIKTRKMIRQKLQSELTEARIQTIEVNPFSLKMRTKVLAQLTDSAFSIDQLAESMAMSRRSLSRKCQEECQQTAGQFITEIRMQTALKLINENQLSLSEIAYGTGYESLSYFSRTFKKFYGKSPSTID